MSTFKLNRRKFLIGGATVTGGLVLGISLSGDENPLAPVRGLNANAYLAITEDNEILFQLDKMEMGQGVYTALPMILAEELEVDPRDIKIDFVGVHSAYADPLQVTGGSTSVATRWDVLRETGAKARTVLIQAAANQWGVATDELYAEKGKVINRSSGQSLSYGELASAADALDLPGSVEFKDPSEYKYVGQPLRRLDGPMKSTGNTTYGIDVQLPDMKVAVVLRNPHFGGERIPEFDASEALQAPGVVDVFAISSGIAVVADTYWHARKASEKVEYEWDKGPLANVSSASIKREWERLAQEGGRTVRDEGNATRGMEAATEVHEVVYEVPYMAHATMEPQNSTALVEGDQVTVWSPNQCPDIAQAMVSEALGIPKDNITIHNTMMGGGFGRRGDTDFAAEAAEVASHVTGPVKTVWSREDDMRHDCYRPATYNVLRAGLDSDGQAHTWEQVMVSPSFMITSLPKFAPLAPEWMPKWFLNGVMNTASAMLETRDPSSHEGIVDHQYAFDSIHIENAYYEPGIEIGPWRSVGHSQNAFIKESFIDELAYKAEMDPLEFRRQRLQGNERLLPVLNFAAEKANWGKAPEGIYQGIAVHESFGSVTSHVVEVSKNESGKIRIERVVCGVDCGIAINPDQVKAQIESAIVFGLSAAAKSEITIAEGAVVQSNFHDFEIMRMDESPKIEVHILPSTERPTGAGEPGTPPVAPALANAVFAATGERQRKLPLNLG